MTKGYIIIGWPENWDQMLQDIRMYWTFWDDMAVINGIILKGRHVVILEVLKTQALDQLHIIHMRIEKNQAPGMWIGFLGYYRWHWKAH